MEPANLGSALLVSTVLNIKDENLTFSSLGIWDFEIHAIMRFNSLNFLLSHRPLASSSAEVSWTAEKLLILTSEMVSWIIDADLILI